MVKDPACGVYVPRRDAIEARVRGENHFFCSKECLEKFKKGIVEDQGYPDSSEGQG